MAECSKHTINEVGFGLFGKKMSKHIIDGMVPGCLAKCPKHTMNEVDFGVLSRVLNTHHK